MFTMRDNIVNNGTSFGKEYDTFYENLKQVITFDIAG